MKHDIDALMQKHDVDALLIMGSAQHNPSMVYFTGVRHVNHADLIKKRGEKGILFHASMERDEAAKSGLDTISFDQFPNKVLFEEAGDDFIKAFAIRYKKMFAECGISKGKVALYGNTEVGEKFAELTQLQKLL